MDHLLKSCTLCPRRCAVDRLAGRRGYCGAGKDVNVVRAAPHHWEEPCLSGDRGSGTVFFSYCPMRCVYCQNALYDGQDDRDVTPTRLGSVFLRLQEQNVHNINLVTPTQYLPQILQAIHLARENGLVVPVVYNTGGYETVDSVKLLENAVDIFLPDCKYHDDRYAQKYSGVPSYFRYASSAITQMVKQAGPAVFDEYGIMQTGVIVRHLVLPGLADDSKKIIRYLYESFGDDVYLSIMNQYTPVRGVQGYPELNRAVAPDEYNDVVDYALSLGVENGFIQESGAVGESFIPDFRDGIGILD